MQQRIPMAPMMDSKRSSAPKSTRCLTSTNTLRSKKTISSTWIYLIGTIVSRLCTTESSLGTSPSSSVSSKKALMSLSQLKFPEDQSMPVTSLTSKRFSLSSFARIPTTVSKLRNSSCEKELAASLTHLLSPHFKCSLRDDRRTFSDYYSRMIQKPSLY